MMNKTILCAVLLGGMALPACAFDFDFGNLQKTLKSVQKVQQATEDVPEPKEIELGGGVASNLLGAAPLLQNKPVQRYVNDVGRWLALQTERPDLPWQFGVLDDNDVNAFASPGGYVLITKGLLSHMKSEAELAGVLAHEISHVLRKHHLQAIKKGARTGLMAEFAGQAMQQKGAVQICSSWSMRAPNSMRAAWTRTMSSKPIAWAWSSPRAAVTIPMACLRCCRPCRA